VSKLVGKQAHSRVVRGSKAVAIEIDIVAEGECLGLQGLAQSSGPIVVVQAHPAEVLAKAWFKI
jgi:hypothetical protein